MLFKQLMAFPAREHGPRRVDGHLASRVLPATHQRYRRCLTKFTSWLLANKYFPEAPTEFDDLAVEFKVDCAPSKSDFEGLLAGLEYVLPALRGQLAWSRACLAGWSNVYKARHTVPMSRPQAHLFACHLASMGHNHLAIGLLLQ